METRVNKEIFHIIVTIAEKLQYETKKNDDM